MERGLRDLPTSNIRSERYEKVRKVFVCSRTVYSWWKVSTDITYFWHQTKVCLRIFVDEISLL